MRETEIPPYPRLKVPWKVLATIGSLTVFGLVALVLGHVELAAVAGGALAGYLGKVNGARD